MDHVIPKASSKSRDARMSRITKIYDAAIFLHRAARHYSTTLAFQVRRAKYLQSQLLFSFEEMMFWGLTDPRISKADIDAFMSTEARVRLLSRVNNESQAVTVDNKAHFAIHCANHKVRTPDSFGLIPCPAAVARTPERDIPTLDWQNLPNGNYIAKPNCGMNGKGILVFDKQADTIRVGDGDRSRNYDILSFKRLLTEKCPNQAYLIERRMEPHRKLAALTGSPGLQTVRLVTFIDLQGIVHFLFGRFKILRVDNFIDNLMGPDRGNLISDVRLEDGSLHDVRIKIPGAIGLESRSTHPDTGFTFTGFNLPDWREVLVLTRRAACSLPDLRCLAWDIGLSSEGPIVIEANYDWHPFPFAPITKPMPDPEWSRLTRL